MISILHYLKRSVFENSLSSKENDEVLKRWFLAKNYIWSIQAIFLITFFIVPLWWILYWNFSIFIKSLWGNSASLKVTLLLSIILQIIVFSLYAKNFLWLIFLPKLFYHDWGVYVLWREYSSASKFFISDFERRVLFSLFQMSPQYPGKYIESINKSWKKIKESKLYYYWIGGIGFLTYLLAAYAIGHLPWIAIFLWIISWILLIRSIIEYFHPLYAFWNLGEKIQLLTPKIEDRSRLIQENFEKDINFRVLSDGFDSLFSTFSLIVSLVIKLERIEKRANTWNLFDSQKYISSLRSDIVEPLRSLRSFLENHREKLISSQKELQKVRICGINGTDPSLRSGWQEQGDLSSKRGESLIAELDENIGKLDVMIGKMG